MKSTRHTAKASKLASALHYQRAGYPILPLWPGSKLPVFKNRLKAATNDQEKIRAWWRQNPDYNIGIATGRGLVVFDYDTRIVSLTGTFQVRTPRGTHVYLQAVERVKSRHWICDDLSKHINVIGEGGYVVGAGSTVGGMTYEPSGAIPPVSELLEFPCSLYDSAIAARRKASRREPLADLDTPGAIERTRAWLIAEAPEATEGASGSVTAFKVASRCRDFGLSEAVTAEIMLAEWNELKAVPPWTPEGLAIIVRGAYAPAPTSAAVSPRR